MDRAVTGDFTIGGRGSNRSFHGKVASMVITTLLQNDPMPTDAEIKLMITDPQKWEDDYKIGQGYRIPNNSYTSCCFQNDPSSGFAATQIWLMGDGQYDAFATIRNDVRDYFQSYTPMNMISMQSNDIETVSINGLGDTSALSAPVVTTTSATTVTGTAEAGSTVTVTDSNGDAVSYTHLTLPTILLV